MKQAFVILLLLAVSLLGCSTTSHLEALRKAVHRSATEAAPPRAAPTSGMQLAAAGRTQYRIVVADDATVEVLAAAGELADFLKQVTGAEFPVVKSGTNRSERQILVGRSPVVDKMVSVDWKALGPEGFVIRTVGSKLVIAGGPRRGTINGVYTFLEDIVGCRWYMPSFSVIPKKPKLALKPLNVRMIPVFGMRWLNFNQSLDWSVRNHLNYFPRNNKKIDLNNPKLAGTNHANGRVVHTLVEDGLLKKAVFDTHPEYFALVKGERVRTAQPCLTNPDLLNHIVRRAKEWIETEDPPGQYISISGGDHPGVCECKPCTKVFKKHGHAGTEMIFVNKVAAELEKDYPDMPVYASAYSFTQWAPRDVKMHKNVMVHYCPIHLCYFHAFDECDYNVKQRHPLTSIKEWLRIAPTVNVWYYALSPPDDMLYPYPNINSLSRNFKLMRDAGVKGFMVQNSFRFDRPTGGLHELKDYLYAKLMWDPNYDVQKGIKEFCRASYGAAAPQIIAYVKLVNERVTYYPGDPVNDSFTLGVPGMHMRFGRRVPIKKDRKVTITKLFREAERNLANDPGSMERFKRVKLSLDSVMK